MPTVKSPALKPLLQSPQLPTYVREMQSYLNEESQKRDAFYDWITPDVKAEFINEDYAVHGVAEYWLVDPKLETVEQYILENERYQLLLKVNGGSLASAAVQGFVIPVAAIFDSKAKNQALAAILMGNSA